MVAPDLVPIIENIAREGGLSTKVIVEDYSEIIKTEKSNKLRKPEFSWTAYYDIDDINGYLKNMSKSYPKSTKLIIGGKSYEGRDILGLRIKTQSNKEKPVIFIESDYGTSKDPCDYQTYGGSKPFSEIETRTLSEYISKLDNLKGYIAFHADAQLLLLPYSDSTEHDQYYDDLKKIGQTSLDYGYEVNKEKYEGPATAAELLYKASGGSMDWVHQTVGTPLTFTYELRGNHFHWPSNRIPEQGDEVTQMMVGLTTEARKLGYFSKN
ncbi:unnamed protein product [Arctia plantaginis]|uniref:Peptidase M14 domain-containing protein n=1 Tax=Arctia plantaginis TaxID=874455 RepID=A0A8S0ZTN3_ARCPL|nr:unnamed protein product [Arctia plantaginis]